MYRIYFIVKTSTAERPNYLPIYLSNYLNEGNSSLPRVRAKKMFPETTSHKIFETSSSFHVK